MPVEYDTVLLVLKCVAKIPWYHNCFLHKTMPVELSL